MKSPWRSWSRILFLIIVVILLAVGGILAWFTSWRSDKLAELDRGSEVYGTKRGPVESAIRGEGPAVLIFHGTPGGYDQALLLGEGLDEAGFQVIAPSRPGYLRTPLQSGLLPEQQADAMHALLDFLEIRNVVVLAVSGGGPSGLQFALRHPDRVRGLILLSAVTDPVARKDLLTPDKQVGKAVWSGLTGDVGSWLAVKMGEYDPKAILEKSVAVENTGTWLERADQTNFILAHPEQLDWFRELLESFAPLSPRMVGTKNDLLNEVALMTKPPYGKVEVPTLGIYGTMDRYIPIETARTSVGEIPNSRFHAVEGAGQLTMLGPDGEQVRKLILDFLREHSPTSTPAP